jgi:hypothetical protein
LYLFTKNASAGAALVAPFLPFLGIARGPARDFAPEGVALLFLLATLLLLLVDLGRPDRFWRLLFKPNTRSWLVKGAWVLIAFGLVEELALGARLMGWNGAADLLRWIAIPPAVLTSGYSAWLFAQCRGRDLWIEPGLFGRLVLRAAILGALLALFLPGPAPAALQPRFLAAPLLLLGAASLARETLGRPHGRDARLPRKILRGRVRKTRPGILLAAAGLLTLAAGPVTAANHVGGAGLRLAILALAVTSMLLYERAWIVAGQEAPIS